MDAIIELELTGMAYGGAAVGRHEGRAVFVNGGISGERVRARIRQDKGRFALADIVEVLTPSPARTHPRCGHVGQCGGCQWQHIDYTAQLTFKQQIVADQLARIGGLPDVLVLPTMASPDPWAYRSHVTFHTTDDGRLGFVGVDDRRVVVIEECPISRPELLTFSGINTEAQRGFTAEQQRGRAAEADFKRGDRIRVQIGSDGSEGMVAVSAREDSPARVVAGVEAVHFTVKGKRFRVSGGSFFQVNLAQAAVLVEQMMAWLKPVAGATALDLYSGAGLFSAFLAERFAQVVGVESFAPAVEDARFNLRGLSGVEFHIGSVEAVLAGLSGSFSAAVVDPPRAGMAPAALEALIAHQPTRIAYVSCDSSTLARDAKRLVTAGYRLAQVQPVDMFPQTYHIEAVAWFESGKT
jgi:23S rRNA (uracil1939-C5)-methyltransferase